MEKDMESFAEMGVSDYHRLREDTETGENINAPAGNK